MKVECILIRELMLNEFEPDYNATGATKNILRKVNVQLISER